MPRNLQCVWPKDGQNGTDGHRGFFRGLDDILRGKGPDMFLQRKGSRRPIKADRWSNWDSYHDTRYWAQENTRNNRLFHPSRHLKRYDPYTRTYKEWMPDSDFGNVGVDGWGVWDDFGDAYPHFTLDEWQRMRRRNMQGRPVNPRRMGRDWSSEGPKRFQQEHDQFWRGANRIGENASHWPFVPRYFAGVNMALGVINFTSKEVGNIVIVPFITNADTKEYDRGSLAEGCKKVS